jgi:pyruvate,water dikinase
LPDIAPPRQAPPAGAAVQQELSMRFWKIFGSETEEFEAQLRNKYACFRRLLTTNNEILRMITELEGVLTGGKELSLEEIRSLTAALKAHVETMVADLNVLADGHYRELESKIEKIAAGIEDEYRQAREPVTRLCLPLEAILREHADAVGGKSSNLGEVRNRVGLPVPQGFAVTSCAYRSFVGASGIQQRLGECWNRIDLEDRTGLSRISAEMMRLVREAPIQKNVEEEIARAARDLHRKAHGKARVSVRSSAIGEDGRSTFAGLYATFLNVPLEQILQHYREVVASKFSRRALFYMRTHGFRESDIAMSVGCFLMVDAVAAGVAYSVDPTNAALNKMLVSAVWGLGKPVVDGTTTPDSYIVSRLPGRGILEIRVAKKEKRLVPAPEEGLMEEPVPLEMQDRPCLNEDQITKLVEYLRALEAHYRSPQDVEWALDRSGRLYVLQTRSLRIGDWDRQANSLNAETRERRILLEGGRTAAPGAGCGPVVHAESDEDLRIFPSGGVLVARQTSPKFVEVMTRAAAILTDVGSPTGHMASLSREYHVPTIVDAGRATGLREGLEVTVDATRLKVFEGRVEEIMVRGLRSPQQRPDLPSLALLERVVARVARLNLTDPSKNAFRAKNCRTYHDVARFCHEMAIWKMFDLNDYRQLSDKGLAFRLDSDVPLGIHIIDLGGGLDSGIRGGAVKPGQILSVPMRALWKGMSTPGIRWGGARPIDLKGFLSVLANTMYDPAKGERELGDTSYAILSSNYLNFGSRLGYHFATLDAVCGENLNDNYILFRFKGGAADIERRVRRTRFVGEILAHYHFVVDQKDDLLHAWVKKLPEGTMEDLLTVVGRLIGCARQLDIVMDAEATLERCERAFLNGEYGFFDFKSEKGTDDDERGVKRSR